MSVVTVLISIDGSPLDNGAEITQVDIYREIGKIATAELVMLDGNPASRHFALSEGPELVPGKEVEITLRFEGNPDSEQLAFKGLITRHSIEASRQGGKITLTLKDAAIKMTLPRKQAVFAEMTDSDLFSQMISDNGLEAGTVAATDITHAEIIQYACSDWDMLSARADLLGFWVNTHDGVIDVLNPEDLASGSPTLTLEYGIDEIYHFKFEADAERQLSGIATHAWNMADQAGATDSASMSFNPNPGDLDPAAMADVVGAPELALHSAVPLLTEELTAWAKGKMLKNRNSLVRGSISIRGNAAINLGDLIEIAGMSSHFNGNLIVSGLRHRINYLGWITDIQFGRKDTDFLIRPDAAMLPASGLLPAIQGVQLGKVMEIADDPLSEFRVKVKILTLGEEAEPVWARVMRPDAGTERGIFFLPEVDDEVILAFLNNDPRFPVVMGSLHSSAQVPPVESGQLTADNFHKGIFTKTGLKIAFDDETSTIIMATEDGNSITLNSEEGLVEILDANGNEFSLNSDGINLVSAGDINIEASGNVVISGAEVDVQ